MDALGEGGGGRLAITFWFGMTKIIIIKVGRRIEGRGCEKFSNRQNFFRANDEKCPDDFFKYAEKRLDLFTEPSSLC